MRVSHTLGRSIHLSQACLGWTVFPLTVSLGFAQPDIAVVQTWVDSQSQLGKRLGHDLAIEARWTRWIRMPADAATKQLLAQDLSQTPDHPLRANQAAQRELVELGLTSERMLAAGGGRWRMSSVEKDRPDTLWHTGASDGDSWIWSGREVTVIDAARPPEGRDFPSMRYEYLQDLLHFMSGGLATPRSLTWKVETANGDTWVASASESGGEVRYRAEGKWDDVPGRAEVRSVHVDGQFPGVYSFDDWKDRDGIWSAGTVNYQSDSGFSQRNTLHEIGVAPRDRVKSLAATPSPYRADLLLGETRELMIVDLKGSQPKVAVQGPAGMTELDVVETPAARARKNLRFAGWAIGIGALVVILAFWWRKRGNIV